MNNIIFNIRRWLSWQLLRLSNCVDDREASYQFDSDIMGMHEYKKRLIIFTKKHIYSYTDKNNVQRIKLKRKE